MGFTCRTTMVSGELKWSDWKENDSGGLHSGGLQKKNDSNVYQMDK